MRKISHYVTAQAVWNSLFSSLAHEGRRQKNSLRATGLGGVRREVLRLDFVRRLGELRSFRNRRTGDTGTGID